MPEGTKRGSNGGNARAAKLSKEERSAIAKQAAQKRWAKKNDSSETSCELSAPTLIDTTKDESREKHCPSCLAGESLEEGEGTHILGTVEHPVVLPVEFQDADKSVEIPPPPPQKPVKQKAKPVPKEFRSASSYAEKRLPQAIKEKSESVATVAKLDAEINDLVRVIKALGGSVDPLASNHTYPQNGNGYPQSAVPYQPPRLPDPYPEYQQPAPPLPVVTPPKAMAAGGAGVAQGMLSVPTHWYEG
jgi:hypothetical protein